MDSLNHSQLLLVGLPRSGTTWIAKLIDSHPDIVYRHEPDTEFRMNVPVIINSDDTDYEQLISEYCEHIFNRKGVRVCGKQPFFKKAYFNLFTEQLFRISVLIAKLSSRIGISFKIIEIINTKNKKAKLLWKSIESAGRVGAILKAVPDIKVVYVVRSPYGQISSVIDGEAKQKFTDTGSSADDYGFFEYLLTTKLARDRGITMEHVLNMTKLQRLALRWLLHNEHALTEIDKSPHGAIIIRYEDVCVNPEKEAKDIFVFLGLQWYPQTKEFLSNKTDEDKYYSVFKSPINSMEKWKEKLTAEDVEVIDQVIKGTKSASLYGVV